MVLAHSLTTRNFVFKLWKRIGDEASRREGQRAPLKGFEEHHGTDLCDAANTAASPETWSAAEARCF